MTGERNLQVQRIEEEVDVFALVVGQFDLFEGAIDDCGALEIRCWLRDLHVMQSG